MSALPNGAVANPAALLTPQDIELIRRVATNVWDYVDEFSHIFSRTLHERMPELGSIDDTAAVAITRKSSIGSMHEFLAIMRAGIFAPEAIETAPEALEHVRYLQSRGIGLGLAIRWYHTGVSMFEPLVVAEFERCAPDNATLEKMKGLIRQFLFVFVDQLTKRLAAEYGVTERENWVHDPDAPVLHDSTLADVTHRFLTEFRRKDGAAAPTAARRHCEEALERFCAAMETAAADPRLTHRLARANTTVHLALADEPDLDVTLLLDREPIEVVDGDTPADVDVTIASVDLDRLCSPDFHLAMAIARGRVHYEGNVRRFLRVTPVVRHASLPSRADTDTPAATPTP
jgi:hypothetical protein